MDPIQSALDSALSALARLSPELLAESDAISDELSKPPRIVITGRLKAGKSTLVNALIGAPVAETATLEATNVVTAYQYGAPDRAEVVLKTGDRIPVATRRGEVASLPVPADEVDFVERWMPAGALRNYTLIDTPGLATLTEANERTTRRALGIDGFEQTREASASADAAVFLFDAVPRADEIEFVQQLGFTPLNLLGVLSRADSFGPGALGAEDPIDAALAHSSVLLDQLRQFVFRVIPVAGLMAQSAIGGAVTESFARRVAANREKSPAEVMALVHGPRTPDRDEILELIEVIGEYGLIEGRRRVDGGATELTHWLKERSGVPALEESLHEALGPYARLHRAWRCVERFERLVYEHREHGPEIRRLASALRFDPRMYPVLLLGDLKALLMNGADPEITAAVFEVCQGTSNGQRLGLSRFASGFEIIEAVRQKRAKLDGLALRMLNPAEEVAVVNLRRAYAELDKAGQLLT